MIAHQRLGSTPFEVSRLGFGAMSFGSPFGQTTPDDRAGEVLNLALDLGITFIDTAPLYNRSEELIGTHIGHRRGEFVLATKCSAPWDAQRPPTAENARLDIENSLRRLRTDVLDLVQIHGLSQAQVEENGILEVLLEAQAAGKVRCIGLSVLGGCNEPPELAQRNQAHFDEHYGTGRFAAFQLPYSALDRHLGSRIERAHQAGIGTIIRNAVAKGEQKSDGNEQLRRIWSQFEEARIDELCEPSESRSAFLLRFALSFRAIDTLIAGTSNPKHLRENVDAARRGPLPDAVYAEAVRRLDAAAETACVTV